MISIKSIPYLSRERELELGKIIQVHGITSSEGIKARNDLVEANLKFVLKIAPEYCRSGNPDLLEDLIQEGFCGLIKAAEKYDYNKGFKFLTYAIWWVRQYIIQFLNQNQKIEVDLDAPITEECDKSFLEFLEDVNTSTDYELWQAVQTTDINVCLGRTLTDKENLIVRLYFGLDSDRFTLEQIGMIFNVTRERIRQIKKRALSKLKQRHNRTLKPHLNN